ncbi:META domain-containing protein [Streptomyces katsurahamanus]|uniref:META domain-containing protein n=1 Tax=Streptomyces katsurahamanus TaxID=2577098 RepID=A0ABW9NYR0_9ACTN|nr:META domain-containing protein [Streptomyces katsurahamanus]MQS38453.1 META domain-containing protein [Streptomyces katsurahamanus]
MRRNQLSVSVIALALLTLAACGSQKDAGPASVSDDRGVAAADLPLTGVRWAVETVTVDGRTSPAPTGTHIELTEGGRVEGGFGCNLFRAETELKGDTLTVGAKQMTKKSCSKPEMDFERTAYSAFSGSLKAELAGRKLTLTAAKGAEIALSSEPAAPLTGTKWTVNSLMDGDTSTSLPAGTENSAHLTFAKDGTVRGSLGCNTFTATAKVSGEKITLGRLASTRRMCTGTLQQVEAHLTKVLDGKATFRLLNRGLTLTGPDDQGVVATAERTPAGSPTPDSAGQR